MTKRLFRAVSSQIIRVNFARLYQTLALNLLSVNASVSDTQLALPQFMSHTESLKCGRCVGPSLEERRDSPNFVDNMVQARAVKKICNCVKCVKVWWGFSAQWESRGSCVKNTWSQEQCVALIVHLIQYLDIILPATGFCPSLIRPKHFT